MGKMNQMVMDSAKFKVNTTPGKVHITDDMVNLKLSILLLYGYIPKSNTDFKSRKLFRYELLRRSST